MSEVHYVKGHATLQYLSWSTVIGNLFFKSLALYLCKHVIHYMAIAFLDANNPHFCHWSVLLTIFIQHTHFYLTEGENNGSYSRELQVKNKIVLAYRKQFMVSSIKLPK